mmetsp:Transcript_24017/g.36328  ORF Transcript_24017/g.36328 Transcript_24017/m.36328 type:complete len:80 (+) Transcript_24017:124-363(+)|eukprot:CAMPEP_0194783560 /NCGR_PEP_ID=MMETSP0323_2-20130528/79287_1 /TAXON_ID=2866 ORGANISM="Crypthecodinium cohnii, Strain Seligo" /NCGR_SAMPLE_ID=MMETSP0323_2 /ASSEMBLY_ACC=CAM_ASM_000346 /LENGTH=79 /DNA_ID=CAMNT_0039722451 /DNA_START=1169 /DNA_END=1408 /DNA_ORIENTATION=+
MVLPKWSLEQALLLQNALQLCQKEDNNRVSSETEMEERARRDPRGHDDASSVEPRFDQMQNQNRAEYNPLEMCLPPPAL